MATVGGSGNGRTPVGIVTCLEFAAIDDDWPLLRDALARRGIAAALPAWDDPAVDWSGFDLVVTRSTWDCVARAEEYLAWAERAAAVTELHNPLPVVSWAMDKHYMGDLGAAGIPIVPTDYVDPDDAWSPPDGEFVVKPTVSGGGIETARYDERDRHDAVPHVRRLHANGATVMVQPYVPSVDEQGETALVFFGRQFSHALNKAPLLARGVGVVDRLWEQQQITPSTPTEQQLDLATQTVNAVADRFGAAPLYSRIDVVDAEDGHPVVLEAELIDPVLFLTLAPGAADRLAERIAVALS